MFGLTSKRGKLPNDVTADDGLLNQGAELDLRGHFHVRADFVAESVPVQAWHEDVGDDHVHALTLQQSECVHAVMGLEDRVAFAFELRAEQLQAGGGVVNDEEVHGALLSPAR